MMKKKTLVDLRIRGKKGYKINYEPTTPLENLSIDESADIEIRKLVSELSSVRPEKRPRARKENLLVSRYLSDPGMTNFVYEQIIDRMKEYQNNTVVMVRLLRILKKNIRTHKPGESFLVKLYQFCKDGKVKNSNIEHHVSHVKMIVEEIFHKDQASIQPNNSDTTPTPSQPANLSVNKFHLRKMEYFDLPKLNVQYNLSSSFPVYISYLTFGELHPDSFTPPLENKNDSRYTPLFERSRHEKMDEHIEQIWKYKKKKEENEEEKENSETSKSSSNDDYIVGKILQRIIPPARKTYISAPHILDAILKPKINDRLCSLFFQLLQDIYVSGNVYAIDQVLSFLLEMLKSPFESVRLNVFNVIYSLNMYMNKKYVTDDLFEKLRKICFYMTYNEMDDEKTWLACYECVETFNWVKVLDLEIVKKFYEMLPDQRPEIMNMLVKHRFYNENETLNVETLREFGGIWWIVDEYVEDRDRELQLSLFLVLFDYIIWKLEMRKDNGVKQVRDGEVRFLLKVFVIENSFHLVFHQLFKYFPYGEDFVEKFTMFLFTHVVDRDDPMDLQGISKPMYVKKKSRVMRINTCKNLFVPFVRELFELIVKYIRLDPYILGRVREGQVVLGRARVLNKSKSTRKMVENTEVKQKEKEGDDDDDHHHHEEEEDVVDNNVVVDVVVDDDDSNDSNEVVVAANADDDGEDVAVVVVVDDNEKREEKFWQFLKNMIFHSPDSKHGIKSRVWLLFLLLKDAIENKKKELEVKLCKDFFFPLCKMGTSFEQKTIFLMIFEKLVMMKKKEGKVVMRWCNEMTGLFLKQTNEKDDVYLFVKLFYIILDLVSVQGPKLYHKEEVKEEIMLSMEYLEILSISHIYRLLFIISNLRDKRGKKKRRFHVETVENCRITLLLLLIHKCERNFNDLVKIGGVQFFKLILQVDKNPSILYFASKFLMKTLSLLGRDKYFSCLRTLVFQAQKKQTIHILENPFFQVKSVVNLSKSKEN